jgi:TATA-box binding protein (TBP) (component of TFIID and TFIIIB)
MSTEYDYKIFTMTVSCIFKDCTFNLINIGKYLDIDSDILGIKYNYGKTSILKGSYTTSMYKKLKVKNSDKVNKVLFYNQVSLSIKVDENIVNAKLFLNGSLHLTGIKNSNEPKKIMVLLYNKLLNLKNKNDIVLLCNDTNGVLIDNNNMIYSDDKNKSIIGYVLDDKYIIDKKCYKIDFYTGYFISDIIETKRTRQILDFSGNVIGYTKIELMKNKLKLYKNNVNIHFDNKIYINDKELPYCLIYYDNTNYSSIIGKIVYNCKNIDKNKNNKNDIIEYNYNCNPFKLESSKLNYNIDINCINIYFNIKIELNRNRLFQKLLQDNYMCQLNSKEYAGLKLIYKKSLNKQKIPGICECTTKCTCTNITFSIFQSGNVNVFGFKNELDIKEIVSNFKKIITKNIDYIKKRIF